MPEKHLSPAQHEPSDVGLSLTWTGTAAVLLGVVFLTAVVFWIFPRSVSDWRLHAPLPKYPAPSLQTNPRADMERFYAEEMQWLNGTGWINKPDGVTHIPIQEAMRIIAQEGIPGWPTPSEKPPGAQAKTSAATPSTEKAHEASQLSSSGGSAAARSASARACGAGSQRHCLQPEAREPTPAARHVPRRHRRHRAIWRSS
jgi:hypothetical protein